MNLKDSKQLIQDTYDKGLFAGLAYNDNKILLMVKESKHWIETEINSEYPQKDFAELKTFVDTLGKPKKAIKLDEES